MTFVRLIFAAFILAATSACTANGTASSATRGGNGSGNAAVPVTTAPVVRKAMPI